MKFSFGIDVGGMTVKFGFFDASGQLLEKWEIPTVTEDGGEKILPQISRCVDGYLKDKQICKEDIFGIGLGVPGAVRLDGTVNRCINLGWGVRNVAHELEELTKIPVAVGNDANLAALGEAWYSGWNNMLMITLGTGVGGGVVTNGEPLYGAHGSAGEIGHITVDPMETQRCACGKRGCAEQYCSATGIVRLAKEQLKKTNMGSALRKENITCKDVLDAGKAGDPVARIVLEQVFERMGRLIAAACCCIDPEQVVIGGGVSQAGQFLLDGIRPYFDQYIFHACNDITFHLARLGNDAGIYGACKLAMNTFM